MPLQKGLTQDSLQVQKGLTQDGLSLALDGRFKADAAPARGPKNRPQRRELLVVGPVGFVEVVFFGEKNVVSMDFSSMCFPRCLEAGVFAGLFSEFRIRD